MPIDGSCSVRIREGCFAARKPSQALAPQRFAPISHSLNVFSGGNGGFFAPQKSQSQRKVAKTPVFALNGRKIASKSSMRFPILNDALQDFSQNFLKLQPGTISIP
ncbi:MAG: hypothetical protein IJJ99_05075 [Oscillospiraceae bacterium]|nr:hypothetical protein [Oscillospiraceae bacterium]